jgi:hypothetical protein
MGQATERSARRLAGTKFWTSRANPYADVRLFIRRSLAGLEGKVITVTDLVIGIKLRTLSLKVALIGASEDVGTRGRRIR